MGMWRMLRALAGILKVIAWLDLIAGGLFVLYILFTGLSASAQYSYYGGSYLAGATLVVALVEALAVVMGFIITMAGSELIMLFISMEEQAGSSASSLRELVTMSRAAAQAAQTARMSGGAMMPPGMS
jgi:hypothetical protein